MPISERLYRQPVLNDQDGRWELRCGHLVRKPEMTREHNWLAQYLTFFLQSQLGLGDFTVLTNQAPLRRSPTEYFIPDVAVVPVALARQRFPRPGMWEMYTDPLPLVVEVWSPSTGDYDVDTKVREYQRRGNLEIWRVHPYERTLTAWRRQADGSYTASSYAGGTVHPVALLGVAIDLDALFG